MKDEEYVNAIMDVEAIFVHKSAYYNEYKETFKEENADLDEKMRKFLELILESRKYNIK